MRLYATYPVLMVVLSATTLYGAGWSGVWDYDVTWGSAYKTNLNAVKVTDSFSITTTASNIVEHSLHSLYGQSGVYSFPACTGMTANLTVEYYAYTRYIYTNNNSLSTTTVTSARTFYYIDESNIQWITNTLTRTLEGGVFEMNLNVHERRQLELYEALYERGSTGNYLSFGHNSLYENTVLLKSMLASVVSGYCNTGIVQQAVITNWGHNDISVVVTNGGVVSTNILPALYWNRTNILKAANFPSNYFTYTPRKDPAYTLGFGRTVTTCVEIIRYPSETNVPPGGTLTNQVVLYDGTVTNVSGQEGTTNCISITYTNIADGFTDSDYTYWGMTNLIGMLKYVAAQGSYEGYVTRYYGYINPNTNHNMQVTKNISYSYSDYHYSGIPWYKFCENPLWTGDSCSSNDNYTPTPSFTYVTNGYNGNFFGSAEYKINGKRETSSYDSDVDYDCDGGTSWTESQDYSAVQNTFQYLYYQIGSYTGQYSAITGAKTNPSSIEIRDYYICNDGKGTRIYTNDNVYHSSYSSNGVSGCSDYDCDDALQIPSIYGHPEQTNQVVYHQNINPLYPLSDEYYSLAKDWYSSEITKTGSVYVIPLEFAEPYGQTQLASEYSLSTLDEYSLSGAAGNCVTNPAPGYWGVYCWSGTSSGYYKKEYTTEYVDSLIKNVKHIINHAVTNGFKYY